MHRGALYYARRDDERLLVVLKRGRMSTVVKAKARDTESRFSAVIKAPLSCVSSYVHMVELLGSI